MPFGISEERLWTTGRVLRSLGIECVAKRLCAKTVHVLLSDLWFYSRVWKHFPSRSDSFFEHIKHITKHWCALFRMNRCHHTSGLIVWGLHNPDSHEISKTMLARAFEDSFSVLRGRAIQSKTSIALFICTFTWDDMVRQSRLQQRGGIAMRSRRLWF